MTSRSRWSEPPAADITDSASSDRPVALVTGAARGIGAATAAAFSAAGWRVVLIDACADDPALAYPLATRAELDTAVATTIRAAATVPQDRDTPPVTDQSIAIGLVADVRDQTGLDGAVADAVGHFGRLDAVVAAAGTIAGGQTVWETTDAVWDSMIGVNLTGAWHLVRAAVPHLLTAPAPRRGRVVVVASAASIDGLPLLGAYTAAKHGVAGLVKALAIELGPAGITANAVCPGSTRTAMLDASAAVYGLASPDDFVGHQAIGRLLEPEEIAAAVVWLCSPAASAITGTVVPVDGGMTAT